MRTIKLIIEYDGSNYLGWQVQPEGPTVQGVIEDRLARLMGEKTHLEGSGRTDAGVHAMGQVAHFLTQSTLDTSSIQRALNSLVPDDIVIQSVEEVGEDFHARKNSISKIYEYHILNRPLRSVFCREYTWHIPQRLDFDLMDKAAKSLIGEHDFAAFRSAGSSTRTTIRRVVRADWEKGRGGSLRFKIEASGFLKQMVRAIVGTLVEVGRGKVSPEEFQRILESKDRRKAGPTAPALGLFLKEVKY